jgi:hypothetical protein
LEAAEKKFGSVFIMRFSPWSHWNMVTSKSGLKAILSAADHVFNFDVFVVLPIDRAKKPRQSSDER